MLDLFRSAVGLAPSKPAALYFDGALSYAELDHLSDALACHLAAIGFTAGDRLGLYMQNIPQFLVGILAAWKCGGIAVPLSPLNRAHELGRILPDCRPAVLLSQDDLAEHLDAAIAAIPGYSPAVLITSALRLQARCDERVLPKSATAHAAADMFDFLAQGTPAAPSSANPAPQDPAFIVYTSGTTGEPKGAIITHDNAAWNAGTIRHWFSLAHGDGPVFGMAPLFHITGLVGGIGLAWQLAEPLILTYRFRPDVVLDALLEHRPGFVVGAITAYMALMNSPGSTPDHYASFKAMVSGGAATPPAVLEAFRVHSGQTLHNGYGLTETAAGVTTVPHGVAAPVDPASGALSVGVPVYDAGAWIADDDSRALAPGEIGEIVLTGRSVSPGYWNKPEATAEAMKADGFRTGDVGFIDSDGWVYVVDRKKDMINASGFKIWPREVEDALYTHPAIREAAVVGVPDPYRGETVRAVISLKAGEALEPDALIAWCRARMAAYKLPSEVVVMDDLPKNPAGKILRRELRD
jgi:long-chain acyl-CoA synthetase